eukprot:g13744.t1
MSTRPSAQIRYEVIILVVIIAIAYRYVFTRVMALRIAYSWDVMKAAGEIFIDPLARKGKIFLDMNSEKNDAPEWELLFSQTTAATSKNDYYQCVPMQLEIEKGLQLTENDQRFYTEKKICEDVRKGIFNDGKNEKYLGCGDCKCCKKCTKKHFDRRITYTSKDRFQRVDDDNNLPTKNWFYVTGEAGKNLDRVSQLNENDKLQLEIGTDKYTDKYTLLKNRKDSNNDDEILMNQEFDGRNGGSPNNAAYSCQAIIDSYPQSKNGSYWINIDGISYKTKCKFLTDNDSGETKGWTLVFNHDMTKDQYFANYDAAIYSNENNPDDPLYSILIHMDHFKNEKNRYEFRYENVEAKHFIHSSQTKSPLLAKKNNNNCVEQYEIIDSSYNVPRQEEGLKYGFCGFSQWKDSSTVAAFTGSPPESSFYIGQYKKYDHGSDPRPGLCTSGAKTAGGNDEYMCNRIQVWMLGPKKIPEHRLKHCKRFLVPKKQKFGFVALLANGVDSQSWSDIKKESTLQIGSVGFEKYNALGWDYRYIALPGTKTSSGNLYAKDGSVAEKVTFCNVYSGDYKLQFYDNNHILQLKWCGNKWTHINAGDCIEYFNIGVEDQFNEYLPTLVPRTDADQVGKNKLMSQYCWNFKAASASHHDSDKKRMLINPFVTGLISMLDKADCVFETCDAVFMHGLPDGFYKLQKNENDINVEIKYCKKYAKTILWNPQITAGSWYGLEPFEVTIGQKYRIVVKGVISTPSSKALSLGAGCTRIFGFDKILADACKLEYVEYNGKPNLKNKADNQEHMISIDYTGIAVSEKIQIISLNSPSYFIHKKPLIATIAQIYDDVETIFKQIFFKLPKKDSIYHNKKEHSQKSFKFSRLVQQKKKTIKTGKNECGSCPIAIRRKKRGDLAWKIKTDFFLLSKILKEIYWSSCYKDKSDACKTSFDQSVLYKLSDYLDNINFQKDDSTMKNKMSDFQKLLKSDDQRFIKNNERIYLLLEQLVSFNIDDVPNVKMLHDKSVRFVSYIMAASTELNSNYSLKLEVHNFLHFWYDVISMFMVYIIIGIVLSVPFFLLVVFKFELRTMRNVLSETRFWIAGWLLLLCMASYFWIQATKRMLFSNAQMNDKYYRDLSPACPTVMPLLGLEDNNVENNLNVVLNSFALNTFKMSNGPQYTYTETGLFGTGKSTSMSLFLASLLPRFLHDTCLQLSDGTFAIRPTHTAGETTTKVGFTKGVWAVPIPVLLIDISHSLNKVNRSMNLEDKFELNGYIWIIDPEGSESTNQEFGENADQIIELFSYMLSSHVTFAIEKSLAISEVKRIARIVHVHKIWQKRNTKIIGCYKNNKVGEKFESLLSSNDATKSVRYKEFIPPERGCTEKKNKNQCSIPHCIWVDDKCETCLKYNKEGAITNSLHFLSSNKCRFNEKYLTMSHNKDLQGRIVEYFGEKTNEYRSFRALEAESECGYKFLNCPSSTWFDRSIIEEPGIIYSYLLLQIPHVLSKLDAKKVVGGGIATGKDIVFSLKQAKDSINGMRKEEQSLYFGQVNTKLMNKAFCDKLITKIRNWRDRVDTYIGDMLPFLPPDNLCETAESGNSNTKKDDVCTQKDTLEAEWKKEEEKMQKDICFYKGLISEKYYEKTCNKSIEEEFNNNEETKKKLLSKQLESCKKSGFKWEYQKWKDITNPENCKGNCPGTQERIVTCKTNKDKDRKDACCGILVGEKPPIKIDCEIYKYYWDATDFSICDPEECGTKTRTISCTRCFGATQKGIEQKEVKEELCKNNGHKRPLDEIKCNMEYQWKTGVWKYWKAECKNTDIKSNTRDVQCFACGKVEVEDNLCIRDDGPKPVERSKEYKDELLLMKKKSNIDSNKEEMALGDLMVNDMDEDDAIVNDTEAEEIADEKINDELVDEENHDEQVDEKDHDVDDEVEDEKKDHDEQVDEKDHDVDDEVEDENKDHDEQVDEKDHEVDNELDEGNKDESLTQPRPSVVGPRDTNIVDKLVELKAMRDAGDITQDEFNTAKATLF